MKLSEAIERYDLAKGQEVRPATRRGYLQRLKVLEVYFGANRDIATIKVDDLRRWRANLASQNERYKRNDYRPTERGSLSVATQRTYIQAVRAFFLFLERETDVQEITISPARDLKLPKWVNSNDVKAVGDADLLALLAAAKASGPRDYAILMFLTDTGCRAGGLCSLVFDRLDMPNRQARLEEKGGKIHRKRFRPEVAAALQAWIEVRPNVSHRFVFVTRTRKPFTTLALYRLLERLAKKAGVNGRFNPHSFRHGAARAMLLNGASLQDVKDELGHSSIDVTSRFYSHLTEDDRAERHDRFSPITRLNQGNDPIENVQRDEQLRTDELTILEKPVHPFLRRVK